MSLELFAIPADFKYVVAAYTLFPLIHIYIDGNVMALRAEANVPLTKLFSDNTLTPGSEDSSDKKVVTTQDRFNCAQKASMNFADHVPTFIIATIAAGLQFPKITAIFTVWYTLARVIHHMGYSTGNPAKRYGDLAFAVYLATSFLATGCAFKFLFY